MSETQLETVESESKASSEKDEVVIEADEASLDVSTSDTETCSSDLESTEESDEELSLVDDDKTEQDKQFSVVEPEQEEITFKSEFSSPPSSTDRPKFKRILFVKREDTQDESDKDSDTTYDPELNELLREQESIMAMLQLIRTLEKDDPLCQSDSDDELAARTRTVMTGSQYPWVKPPVILPHIRFYKAVLEQMRLQKKTKYIDVIELYLSKNNLEKVPDMKKLKNLRTLWMNVNNLTILGFGLQHNTCLLELYLHQNHLRDIDGVKPLVGLQLLYLHSNELQHLDKVVSVLKHLCTLKVLTLYNNGAAQEPDYRSHVLFNMTSLHMLDEDEVTRLDKVKAAAIFNPEHQRVLDSIGFSRRLDGGLVQSEQKPRKERKSKKDASKKSTTDLERIEVLTKSACSAFITHTIDGKELQYQSNEAIQKAQMKEVYKVVKAIHDTRAWPDLHADSSDEDLPRGGVLKTWDRYLDGSDSDITIPPPEAKKGWSFLEMCRALSDEPDYDYPLKQSPSDDIQPKEALRLPDSRILVNAQAQKWLSDASENDKVLGHQTTRSHKCSSSLNKVPLEWEEPPGASLPLREDHYYFPDKTEPKKKPKRWFEESAQDHSNRIQNNCTMTFKTFNWNNVPKIRQQKLTGTTVADHVQVTELQFK